MKTKLPILTFCFFLWSGCSEVYVRQPIGDAPRDITAERGLWEGTWLQDDRALTVVAADAAKGVLRVSWVESDGKESACKSADVYLRNCRDWTFASVRDKDKSTDLFLWGRVKLREHWILIWTPATTFRSLVEDGRLPGAITGDGVVLESLTPEQLQAIVDSSFGVLFDWDEPVILTKVPK